MEAETHEERCKRELREQEEILARVREDSERHDKAVAEGTVDEPKDEDLLDLGDEAEDGESNYHE